MPAQCIGLAKQAHHRFAQTRSDMHGTAIAQYQSIAARDGGNQVTERIGWNEMGWQPVEQAAQLRSPFVITGMGRIVGATRGPQDDGNDLEALMQSADGLREVLDRPALTGLACADVKSDSRTRATVLGHRRGVPVSRCTRVRILPVRVMPLRDKRVRDKRVLCVVVRSGGQLRINARKCGRTGNDARWRWCVD